MYIRDQMDWMTFYLSVGLQYDVLIDNSSLDSGSKLFYHNFLITILDYFYRKEGTIYDSKVVDNDWLIFRLGMIISSIGAEIEAKRLGNPFLQIRDALTETVKDVADIFQGIGNLFMNPLFLILLGVGAYFLFYTSIRVKAK